MNPTQRIEQWLTQSRQNKPLSDRPFISLCFAQSIDGSITINPGTSLALSGSESTKLTHHLRALHEGIIVGVETVLVDDPQLSVRECEGDSPQPIVIDSHLRIPPHAKLCQSQGRRCWVMSTVGQDQESKLENIDVVQLEANADGRVSLVAAMQAIKARGINSVMVEGGAKLITGFLQAGLVDAVVITIAPLIVGGYKAVDDLGYNLKSQLPRIEPLYIDQLESDVIMWGDVRFPEPC